MYLMGTDIGTQGTKTVVVDEEGRVVANSFREYKIITPQPSWAEQWPDVWVKAVIETLEEAIEKSKVSPKEIAGLAISGLYGGSGIPVDKAVEPLYPCLIWMDRRAKEETKWVKDNIPKDKIFEVTGNYVDSYYGFTKMMWIRNHLPDVWKRTYQFVTPKDFVIHQMTGELLTDYTSAGNLGGVFDIRRKSWSDEMCKILGIEMDKLPEKIVSSSDVVGHVNKAYASLTGLLEGTPVIAGGIDAPVAQLSTGSLFEGEHVAMAGTSMCWGTVHDGKYLTPELISYPYVVYDDKLIYTFGGSATSGELARWFRENFGRYEKDVSKKTGIPAYTLLELETKKIPAGSEGVIVLPYFMGERTPIWDPDARGVIFGLSLYHTRAHIYKAMLEAAAYSLRHNMETAINSGIKLNPDCWIVGGVAKSEYWVKIFADVTGYSMKRLENDAEAPYGDAFLAALGTKIIDEPEKIREWVRFKAEVKPNVQNHKVYNKYYGIYKELYEKTKEVMAEVSAMHLMNLGKNQETS